MWAAAESNKCNKRRSISGSNLGGQSFAAYMSPETQNASFRGNKGVAISEMQKNGTH